MSAKSKAVLTTENITLITSQTSPDTITPTTLGVMIQDIIDSMYNTVDGITVGAMTLTQYINSLITQNNVLVGVADKNLFRATKNLDQKLGVAGTTNTLISFEDDAVAPNFDTSNLFYTNKYIPKDVMTRTFSLEGVVIKWSGGGADTARIRILKNGVEIATSTTITGGSSTDVYGNYVTSGSGFTFPPLVISGVTLAISDIVTAEVVNVWASATTPIVTKGVFSNA